MSVYHLQKGTNIPEPEPKDYPPWPVPLPRLAVQVGDLLELEPSLVHQFLGVGTVWIAYISEVGM